MLLEKRFQVRAADLLLALDEKRQITRQTGAGFEPGLDGVQVGQVLAFVVASPSREERAPFNPGLEWRRVPQLERLGRLHVVMAIDQKMRTSGRSLLKRPRQDDRVPLSGAEARVQSDTFAMTLDPL